MNHPNCSDTKLILHLNLIKQQKFSEAFQEKVKKINQFWIFPQEIELNFCKIIAQNIQKKENNKKVNKKCKNFVCKSGAGT